MTGGDGSPLALPPSLLGGVLNGETSAASVEVCGAREERAAASTECDLTSIFGLPARLMGGGRGDAEEADLSPLRGSLEEVAIVLEGKSVLVSKPGVPLRLGILKFLVPFDEGVDGAELSSAA